MGLGEWLGVAGAIIGIISVCVTLAITETGRRLVRNWVRSLHEFATWMARGARDWSRPSVPISLGLGTIALTLSVLALSGWFPRAATGTDGAPAPTGISFVIHPAYALSMTALWSATAALWLIGFREHAHARVGAYGLASTHLHQAIHLLRDQFNEVGAKSESDLAKSLVPILDQFVQALEVVSRSRCRASIHVLFTEDPHFISSLTRRLGRDERLQLCVHAQVKTLARDGASERSVPARRKRSQQQAVWLDNCTAFRELFLDENPHSPVCHYVANLPRTLKEPSYHHGAFHRDNPLPRRPWPLDYKSLMVWPIRNCVGDEIVLVGFLCLDAYPKNSFRRRFDAEIGATLADALFMYMWQWHEESTRVQ